MTFHQNIGLNLQMLLFWIFIFFSAQVNPESDFSFSGVKHAARRLIGRFTLNQTSGGDPVGLNREQFLVFLEKTTLHSPEFIDDLLGECNNEDKNCSWKTECPGIPEIFNSLAVDGRLSTQAFIEALPVAFGTLSSENCSQGAQEISYHVRIKERPTMAEAWGYSIGFVSCIILISNIGACLGPIMQRRFFKRLLQFLVAMGAGSLVATSLLVLIPEAFDLMSIEELGKDYLWKASAAVLSIFIFFSLERVLKTLRHMNKKPEKPRHNMSFKVDPPGEKESFPLNDTTDREVIPDHGHSHDSDKQSLAWMIMAGDAIHKMVDGLSIGAAFTEDLTLGMSISIAICCEEVPHELADIAILLHSGLSIKRSLFVNCLSALMCYVGLVVGVLLGTTTMEATKWVFAVAGGLFLYVPMVDMLPDMSNHLDLLLARGGTEARVVAFLHTVGLLLGAGIILLIANLSEYIVV
ncbi:unnamed protein product [Lymnaea stagnalis]|uniref:Uncharacterized protein n=1 Tax=Lymnaea stagnalis TaxID=6523 RepID=A0AAV2IB80_LYMST